MPKLIIDNIPVEVPPGTSVLATLDGIANDVSDTTSFQTRSPISLLATNI